MEEPGKLTLVISSMYGGKTSYLMRLIETLGYATRCLYINSKSDTRTEDAFSTHNNTLDIKNLSDKLNADMIKVGTLDQVPDEIIRKYQVICIDEAQFFTDLNVQVRKWVDVLGSEVYVAGLNGDFKRENFGQIHLLLPFADDIIKLRDTLCDTCSKFGRRTPASFTKKTDGIPGQQIEVHAKYIPVCRTCYSTDGFF